MSCLVCMIASANEIENRDEALAFGFVSGLYLVVRQRSTALVEMKVFVSSLCVKHAPFARAMFRGMIEDEEKPKPRDTLKEILALVGTEAS